MSGLNKWTGSFKQRETRLRLLQAIFIGGLLAANVIAVKLIGTRLIQAAGIIVYPVTFLVTDTIGEVYGKDEAKRTVFMGFIAQLTALIFIFIARYLPYPPFWDGQEAYVRMFAILPRIVLGSLVAYLASQYHDVWAFHYWKMKTGGRFLWLRNNASTIVSQGIDSFLFVTIAFVGIFDAHHFWMMMLAQYVTKVVIAILDTPFCYLLVKWLKRGRE